MSSIQKSALDVLQAAHYARLASVFSEAQAWREQRGPGYAEPYAVVGAPTDNGDALLGDRDGVPNRSTVLVTFWDSASYDAQSAWSTYLLSLNATPLAVAGFALVRSDVSVTTRRDESDPNDIKFGVDARFTYTLQPS